MATESTIDLTATDGHTFTAYRVGPADTPKGAVVLLQDIPGADGKTSRIADAFAADGYLAIVPTFTEPPAVDGEPEAEGAAEKAAEDAASQLLAEIQSTVDSVKACGKVALVGYGVGGGLAYTAANRINGLACAVSYYGTGIVDNYGEKRKIPILLHFGEADPLVPFDEVSQFRAYRPEVSAFSYPGAAHEFDTDGNASYDESAAKLALDRTMAWISQYVVGQPPIALKNAGAYAQAKVDKKKKTKSAADDMGPPMD
jgi:carboxymethylenebutenolidase